MQQFSENNMHILIVSTGYPTDYVPLDGIFYRDQAEALAAEGNTVGFIAINPISLRSIISQRKMSLGFSHFKEKGVETYLYKYINIPKYPVYCVNQSLRRGAKMFEKYVAAHGLPDIIHLHCYEAILLAMNIREKYNIPFVITEHSSRFMNNSLAPAVEKYAEMAFSESSYTISVSKKFAEILKEKYNREFHYVPNIVDTAFYKPSETDKKKNEFSFLSAGILNENKNHRLLINAFKLFLSSGRTAVLKIAGDGLQAEQLKLQVKELGIEDRVIFSGWISRTELAENMNHSSVFVLPSKKETFGVVLIEAMSCGLPVISTRSGGPESIITSAKTGVLCEDTEQSLFLAMQEVYDNFAAYDSGVIRQEVLENYSQHTVSKKLLAIYNTVLKKNN